MAQTRTEVRRPGQPAGHPSVREWGRNDAGRLDVWRQGGLGDLLFMEPSARRLKAENPGRELVLHCSPALVDAATVAGFDRAEPCAQRQVECGDGLDLNWCVEHAQDAYTVDRVTLFERGCGLPPGQEPVNCRPLRKASRKRRPRLYYAPYSAHGQGSRSLPEADARSLADALRDHYDVWSPGRLGWADYLDGVGECDLALSVDSGGLYLAAALGVPAVGIYEHVDPWLRTARFPHIFGVSVRSTDCSCEHHHYCTRESYAHGQGEPCKRDLPASNIMAALSVCRDRLGDCADLWTGATIGPDTRAAEILGEVQYKTLVSNDRLGVLHDCALETRNGRGCLVELGVYRGGTARVLARTAPEKRLHLFDTFAGIPEVGGNDRHQPGDFAAGLDEAKQQLAGCHPASYHHPPTWHAGAFPETWDETGEIAVGHCDCDTEAGTREFLERAYPRLVPGGYIVVDDYGWGECPGVALAVDAYMADKPERVEVRAEHQAVIRKAGR